MSGEFPPADRSSPADTLRAGWFNHIIAGKQRFAAQAAQAVQLLESIHLSVLLGDGSEEYLGDDSVDGILIDVKEIEFIEIMKEGHGNGETWVKSATSAEPSWWDKSATYQRSTTAAAAAENLIDRANIAIRHRH